ncbi:pyrroloquinoline quinone biosynthesis peptide chaperone PqqD [Acetobacteraceae bacterium KSS8]|uniref:Pyrroloquinoline quinone biosynthesis peptide chaperone PqqD n=1 Tax=Endosaccharibacter trunci TaxID=2812733 RepID=A0ABT1W8A2_9PROT|nr:pyrroloquinoline quinone biosynthesis peptide chaperone PqqD [Acetobacteraceae bacterium KSS8]
MSAAETTVPAFVRGTRLSHDRARDRWVVLAPEKLFVPDATALAVLRLVDGARSIGAMVDDLAARFDAPRAVIAADVLALVDDLIARKVLKP